MAPFLVWLVVLIAFHGCASGPDVVHLPEPDLQGHRDRADHAPLEPLARPESNFTPVQTPTPAATPSQATGALQIQVLPRARWTNAGPRPVSLYALGPGRALTIHHDAIAMTSGEASAARRRMQSIRRTHVNDRGWADIGYHFAIDPAGRIWEARPLLYQGAHVKNHNPGNIGIVLLGDFDKHAPSLAQTNALGQLVRALRSSFSIPLRAVATHQEWPGASTACPGTRLQAIINTARRDGSFGP